MTASASVLCPRFIGREKELATVAERFREAAGGSGTVVLIGGEAGIGKTRFISTVRNIVEDQAARFVVAQCLQHAQSPLGPLADALGDLNAVRPDVLRERSVRAGLARLLPEFEGDAPEPAAAENRRVQYAAIIEALRRFGEMQPLVLAVEDAHWADLATLEFLQYFASRIGSLRLLLLVTYRSDELHRRHPLTLALPKIERGGRTTAILLPALSRTEMQSFVASVLEGRSGIVGSRVRDVIELAEGNPLFAEELLAHTESATRAGDAELRLPLSIRASILERSAVLDDRSREVLCYAAALGRRFDAQLLATLSGHPKPEVGAILREARELQLVHENRSDATFVFRHALIQEAFHEDLLAVESRDLHAQIARELEALPASDERTMELAYHWWAAREREKAAAFNEAAGDIAARRLALADATRFYERALEFRDDEAGAAALSAKLAGALSALDPGDRARRAFERSIAYYERAGDRGRVAELLLDLGRFEWRPGAQLETRRRALEAIAPYPDHPIRFGVLTETACWYSLTADPDTAETYLRQAEPLSRTPKERYLAHYHSICARVALLRGDVERMFACHERAIQIAHETTDFEELCAAYGSAAWGALQVGRIAEARGSFETAIRVARERFLYDREARNLILYAQLEVLVGQLDRARALLLASAELSIDLERPYTRIDQAIVALLIGLQTGDAALIERFGRDELIEIAFSTEEASVFSMIAAPFAALYAARGEPERAASLVGRAIGKVRSIGWDPSLAIAAASFGDPQTASTARQLLQRWAEPSANDAGKAYLDLFDAVLAARTGRVAAGSAARAARSFAHLGFAAYEAMALEADERPREALAIYRRIGATAEVRRLEEVLNPVNRRGRAKSQLTAREHEVAALIAKGESNKAIAAALFLSERTVEHHVASILEKLDAHSRAQIAVIVAQQKA